MDLAAFLNALTELLTAEGAQTRRDILVMSEKLGNIQGQLDQTNYRLTDLSQRMSDLNDNYLHLGRRMDERFEKVDERFQKMEERLERLEVRIDGKLTALMQDFSAKLTSLTQDFNGKLAALAERFDRLEERLTLQMSHLHERIDRIVQAMAPKSEQDALAARVDRLERDLESIKRRLPNEAA